MARLISTNIEGTLNVTGKTTLKDLSATNISGNGTLITNIQWNNIDNKTNVIAGNGLIGGGNLGADVTLNIESANDGISINPDSIQLNSVDNLTTDSATQPLSARQGKNLQDTKVDKTTKINVGGGITGGGSLNKDITITHPGSAASVIERIPNVVTGVSFSNGHVNNVKTYNLDDRYYTESEIDNKFSEISSGLDWKPSVPTYDAILSTYPNPEDGWTVNVDDTDYTYRFTGTAWIAISANSIPLATASVDGKMSKAYASKLDGIAQGANRYVHPNHTGDVTSSGDGATSIVNGKVTNAKLATVSQNTIKGRVSANTGTPEDLTPAQVRTMINVSNGAEVNQPAFSMIKIGAKQALAVSKTDVMEFVAGSNIQLSLDETTKKITITNAYAYTHPVFDTPKFTQSTNTTSANVLYSVTTNNGHVTGGTYKTITPGSNITVTTSVAGEIKINNTYKYTHPTGDGNLHVPATGTENNEKFLMAGASAGELLWQTPPLATSIKPGYLKQLTGSTTEFMRADGTWAVPPSVTYNEYIGTFAGLVPNGNSLSSQDKTSKFLRGDGTWQTPYVLPQATSSVLGGVKIGQGINVSAGTISVPNATTSSNGLMISADKLKLDGIETGANKYVHPTVSRNNTTSSTKPAAGGTFTAIDGVTTNAQGHITGVNTKTITMPVADKYVLPPATKTTLGGVIVGDRINVDAAGKISIANYEPAFTKNSAFNKNFGTSSGTVAEGNHSHYFLTINNTETKNVGRFQMFQLPSNGTINPASTGWFSTLRMQHAGYTNGYWQDISIPFDSDNMYFRRNVNGTINAWRTVWHNGNFDPNTKANTSRAINASGSISGGGNLTADRTITHLTTSGHKHIPSGGASGQLLKWSADGTAVWASVSTSELNALPNPGYGGVHELGRYLDLHMRDSTADYDARIWTDGGQKVCMSGVLAVNSRTIVDASKFTGSTSQTPAISLAIGDSDTGFNWVSDGNVEAWSNNVKLWNLKDVYHTGKKPTKDDVGLSSVNNWGASSDINANSTTQYATTNMVAQVKEFASKSGKEILINSGANAERYIRIGTMPAIGSGCGILNCIINGGQGFGSSIDSQVKLTFSSRGWSVGGVAVDSMIEAISIGNYSPTVFYSRVNGSLVELWAKVATYNYELSMITLTSMQFTLTKDQVTTTAPSGLVAGRSYRVYHTGSKPNSTDVGLGNVPNTVHTTAGTASTVVVRDSAADITARLLRTTYANEARLTGAIAFRVNNSTDNYTRYCSDPAAVRGWLGLETSLTSYVKKSGDTMTGVLNANGGIQVTVDKEISFIRNSDWFKMGFKNASDGDTDSYGYIEMGDNGNEYFKFISTSGSTKTETLSIKTDHVRFKGNAIYHVGHKPTKADVGLGSVNNWGASSNINANSTTEYATTNMVAQVKALAANSNRTMAAVVSGESINFNTNKDYIATNRIFRLSTTQTGLGTSPNYGTLMVLHGGADTGAQIQIPYNTNDIYFRGYSFNTTTPDISSRAWSRIYHTGYKPSSTDVGLGNVNNWGASNDINANSTSQYATTNMVAQVRAEKANSSHTHVELRGSNYISGGNELPNYFGAGKFKYQMLKAGSSGSGGTGGGIPGSAWSDCLWVSSYTGGDVKLSNLLCFSKATNKIGFRQQNYDSTTWGAFNEIYHTGYKPTAADVGLGNVPNTAHTTAATGNTVAVRDSSGDITCRLVRTTYADEAGISGGLVFRKSTSDNYLRTCNNPTNIRNWLGALSTGGGGISGEISRTLSGSWLAGRDTAIINLGCSDSSYASAWRSRGSVYTFASGVLGNNQAGFYVYRNDKTTNGTDGSLYLSNAGYTYSGRVYNAVWNDYAEYFPKKQGYITEAGDIIALALDTEEEIYELATENHDVIVGAHSDEYGMLIGGDTKPMDFEGESEDYNGDRYIPVGLVGRVRVKFKGIARRGMKIVPSDIPGVGRAFDRTKDDYDKVIGYIVENNNEEGIRRVKIKIGK